MTAGLSASETGGRDLGRRLATRDLSAAAAVLNLVENRSPQALEQTAALLEAVSVGSLGHEAPGQIVGVTGPPGVGKSSLLSRLLARWRASDRSVAVLAVDPSSRRSGGSLLGDRVRIERDPADQRVFIRSTAAGDRLGGLAAATRTGATALAAAFDVVVIETVGVGQSETEIADVADEVAVVVQPGSGDVLQFLKSGIMEIPDVLVVTKADLGAVANRALGDLRAALRSLGADSVPVVAVSSVSPPAGIDELVDLLDQRHRTLDLTAHRLHGRRAAALSQFTVEHGERGLRALGGPRTARAWLRAQPAQLDLPALVRGLESRAQRGRAG